MSVVPLSQQPEFNAIGRKLRWLAGQHTSARAMSVLHCVYERRGHAPPHQHDVEEIIYCLEGEATIFLEKESSLLSVGQIAVIPAGVRHACFNTGPGELKLMSVYASAQPQIQWHSKEWFNSPWTFIKQSPSEINSSISVELSVEVAENDHISELIKG